MEKKNLLVRALAPVVLAGLVFVGFSACSQDDGYPEGFVLNDETGTATLAKRSMPQGGESTKPVEPEKPSEFPGQVSMTFKCISAMPGDYTKDYGELSVEVYYAIEKKNGKPTAVRCLYYMDDIPGFSIDNLSLQPSVVEGHYILTGSASFSYSDDDDSYNWDYVGEAEAEIII